MRVVYVMATDLLVLIVQVFQTEHLTKVTAVVLLLVTAEMTVMTVPVFQMELHG